jgi:hypothetical protein
MPWRPPQSWHWNWLVETYPKYAELDRVLRHQMTGGETREILWRLYREDECPYGGGLNGIIDWFSIEAIDHEYLDG